jgi:catechol 2,3-dioxygenase-like lactoylglutathione lyase family enzyme
VPLRLRNITFDCAHPTELARWWTRVTGWEEDPGNPNLPEDDEAALVAPDRSLNLLFVKVPEAKDVKNRVHLDLQATDSTRDDEVVRLVALGATVVADRRRPDGAGWVVMADPEGNEFCVERSPEERAAAPTPPS